MTAHSDEETKGKHEINTFAIHPQLSDVCSGTLLTTSESVMLDSLRAITGQAELADITNAMKDCSSFPDTH